MCIVCLVVLNCLMEHGSHVILGDYHAYTILHPDCVCVCVCVCTWIQEVQISPFDIVNLNYTLPL